jgi:hypothetical protein
MDRVLVAAISSVFVVAFLIFLIVIGVSTIHTTVAVHGPAPRRRRARKRRLPTGAPSAEAAYTRAYDLFRDIRNDTTAMDAGLLGILAAVAAVIVLAFANEAKIGAVATGLLYLSFIACASGFGWGRWRTPEQEKPLEFLLDFFEDPEGAQRDAAQDLATRLRPADVLLRAKRRWALAAVSSLVAGMLLGGLHRMLL